MSRSSSHISRIDETKRSNYEYSLIFPKHTNYAINCNIKERPENELWLFELDQILSKEARKINELHVGKFQQIERPFSFLST